MLTLRQRHFTLKDGTQAWSWQIAGTDRWSGKPVRKGTGTRDRKVAEHKLSKLEETLKARADGRVSHNFAAALEEYLGKRGEDRPHMATLLEHFGRWRLEDIKDLDVSQYAEEYFPGAKASTLVRQVYGPIQWVFNAAARANMCAPKTFAKPTVKRQPVRYARNDDWLLAVLKGCSSIFQRCALLFMSFSGARATEVIRVRICDYSPDRAEIAVRTKGGKERVIPLSGLVNDALKLLPRDRDPQSPLFSYTSRRSLTSILQRACKRAGVEYLSPHKAGRHTFAARLLRNGASLAELKDAGGWAHISVVDQNYAHLERAAVHARIRGVATPIQLEDVTLSGTMERQSAARQIEHQENVDISDTSVA